MSIYKLLANPAPYFGKRVLTYGVLQKVGDSIGLAPAEEVFESNDAISCIQIVAVAEASDLASDGVYAVELAGQLVAPAHGICSAKFERVQIVRAHLARQY